MVLVSDPHDTEVKFDRVGDSSGRYNVLNLQRNRNDSSGKTYEFEIIGTYAALPWPLALCPLLSAQSSAPFREYSLLLPSHPLSLVTARAGGRRSGSSSGGRSGARCGRAGRASCRSRSARSSAASASLRASRRAPRPVAGFASRAARTSSSATSSTAPSVPRRVHFSSSTVALNSGLRVLLCCCSCCVCAHFRWALVQCSAVKFGASPELRPQHEYVFCPLYSSTGPQRRATRVTRWPNGSSSGSLRTHSSRTSLLLPASSSHSSCSQSSSASTRRAATVQCSLFSVQE